jgi:hypothetical protein
MWRCDLTSPVGAEARILTGRCKRSVLGVVGANGIGRPTIEPTVQVGIKPPVSSPGGVICFVTIGAAQWKLAGDRIGENVFVTAPKAITNSAVEHFHVVECVGILLS